jgi:HEAT repeat protein
MSVFSKLGAAVWARRVTILVWAVILIGIFAVVSYNRAAEARTEAALNSTSQQIRDGEVLSLIQSGRLIDALAATQNPNEDAKSDQNVKSVTLRQNAADSVNRLTAAHRISDTQALNNLFLLRKDADSGVKDRATAGLVALGSASQANEDTIIGRLKDGDPDIRGAAVDALSKIGGFATAQKIAPLLKDPAAQDSAQSVLQNIGAASVPLLTAQLNDPDIAFRQRIVSMLGTISSPLSVPDLTKIANGDQASVRRLALVALANTVLSNYNTAQKARRDAQKAAADPKSKPEDVQKANAAALKAAADFAQTRPAERALSSAVSNPEDDSEARTQGALALGRLGSPADVAVLVGVLGDYDSRVAMAALQGVQSVGPSAVGPLTAALSPQQPEQARAAAAQALGGIGTGPAVAALQGVLADKTTPLSVRRSAVIGLGQSGSPAVIPALVASLSDTDGGVASAASDALLAPALEPSAIPLLIAAFTKSTPVPFLASETLSRMGNLPVRALEDATSSGSPQSQQWAAVTLGQTDSKDPTVAAALTPLTKSTDPDVQFAANQALNRLSGT